MMLTSKLVLPVTLLSALSIPALATVTEPQLQGEPGCRFVAPPAPFATGPVHWKGECRDGYASGKGVMSGRGERGDFRIEGSLAQGEISGSAVMTTPGFTYTGTFKAGLPHGQGFFKYVFMLGMYEGEVANGVPHGKGEKLEADRSYYVGEWQGGRRHGYGEATFGTGGSYKGQWKNNKFHGQGTIVYAGSGHTYTGEFADNRVAGLVKPASDAPDGRYAIKTEQTGSNIKLETLRAHRPLHASWDELTQAQQNKMRLMFPAMEAGDEPPFPRRGEQALMEAVSKINIASGGSSGKMILHVLVDKAGKPLKAITYGLPDRDLVRAVSTVAMLQEFKPATCRGEPCEMVYPVNFSFDTR